jgi:hypothetical protein
MLKYAIHEFAARAAKAPWNQTHAVDRLAVPAVSAYCNANTCAVPLPLAGDAVTLTTFPMEVPCVWKLRTELVRSMLAIVRLTTCQ